MSDNQIDKNTKDSADNSPEEEFALTEFESVEEALEDDPEAFEEIIITGQEVVDELQRLIPAALESAEAANKASKLGLDALTRIASSGETIQRATKLLTGTFEKQAAITKMIYIGGGALLFTAVFIYGVMTAQISLRLSELDSVIIAASKRVVNLNSGLETFEELRFAIRQTGTQQQEQTEKVLLLTAQVARVEQLITELGIEMPKSAANHLDGSLASINSEMVSTREGFGNQQAAMAALSVDVAKVERRMATVQDALNKSAELGKDVEALLTLERARYLDVLNEQIKLEKAAAAGEPQPDKPGFIRYKAPR